MGVKKNFGYNLILTLSNYIFPLITYPYVSRVLGVNNIGICNYVDGIIQYYILFSTLGIASFGVREIAKFSDDFEKCSKVFTNLFTLNAILTVVASMILVFTTYTLSSLEPYRPFLLIGLMKLVANLFLTEWFFQGLQLFKYITVRAIIVRLVYVISLFIFIKDVDDANKYYLLTTLTIVVNAIINWRYSLNLRKYSLRNLSIKLIIWPVLVFGYYRILTSMYTTFNIVYLGSRCGDVEVGYFSTATKLYTIIMAVFTAFTTIMVPRVSQLLKLGNHAQLQSVADKTFSILERCAIPVIVFCQFYASHIIFLLSGPGYEGAVLPFRIVIFLLLIIGMEQISIQQFLMASTSNKSILLVSTIGAFVGLSLNLILTEKMGSVGSAISWGCSEFAVLIVGLYLLSRILHINISLKNFLTNTLSAVIYAIPLIFINKYCGYWSSFIIGFLSIVICFVLYNVVLYPEKLLVEEIGSRLWKKKR